MRATLILFISFLAVSLLVPNHLTASFSNYCLLPSDSTLTHPDTLGISADSLLLQKDSTSLATDSINTKKSPIDAPIYKEAKDSLLYSIDGKKVYLWGEATVKYEQMELTAAYIEYDMDSSIVFA